MTASDKPGPGSSPTEELKTLEQADVPPWLPDEGTIISEETFTSPKGRQYRILRTNLTDSDDDLLEGEPTSTTPRLLPTSSWKAWDGGHPTPDKGRLS